ncbi:hypothetical protein L3Q82_012510, partial [Scortum barcoo]
PMESLFSPRWTPLLHGELDHSQPAHHRSLVNKMDEMKLRIVSAKIDSCVAIVTETWLDNNIPDVAVELAWALSSPGRQDCSFGETQFSLQHSDPGQADTEAPQPGTALITVREEIQHLTQWCSNNNLVLNTSKTKEVIVDYRRSRRTEHAPLQEAVECVNNIKFLGIHITSDLTWSMNTAHLVKKAQQRLFFLRKLETCWTLPSAPDKLLQGHNRRASSVSMQQFGMAAALHKTEKDLARVVKTAQGIVGSPLPDLDSIYAGRIQKKAQHIAADPTHPPEQWTVCTASLWKTVQRPEPSSGRWQRQNPSGGRMPAVKKTWQPAAKVKTGTLRWLPAGGGKGVSRRRRQEPSGWTRRRRRSLRRLAMAKAKPSGGAAGESLWWRRWRNRSKSSGSDAAGERRPAKAETLRRRRRGRQRREAGRRRGEDEDRNPLAADGGRRQILRRDQRGESEGEGGGGGPEPSGGRAVMAAAGTLGEAGGGRQNSPAAGGGRTREAAAAKAEAGTLGRLEEAEPLWKGVGGDGRWGTTG